MLFLTRRQQCLVIQQFEVLRIVDVVGVLADLMHSFVELCCDYCDKHELWNLYIFVCLLSFIILLLLSTLCK